jgi:hypothetical protein
MSAVIQHPLDPTTPGRKELFRRGHAENWQRAQRQPPRSEKSGVDSWMCTSRWGCWNTALASVAPARPPPTIATRSLRVGVGAAIVRGLQLRELIFRNLEDAWTCVRREIYIYLILSYAPPITDPTYHPCWDTLSSHLVERDREREYLLPTLNTATQPHPTQPADLIRKVAQSGSYKWEWHE